jgi:hypothetical protein
MNVIMPVVPGALCRPFGTRVVCFVYPALTCRATGCTVPTELQLRFARKTFPRQDR